MSKTVTIGLDIGSSAVRAAEVVVDGQRRVVRRFAQVGLPDGAVAEGEVRDKAAVRAAVERLWQHGRFTSKSVVVGLGSQRAMVRQVEMPQMAANELRSALRFKIGEFLPIPVELAVADFAPLSGSGGGGETCKVLMVAAQREVVVDEVATVEAAGLRVEAVDVSSLALLRAVGSQPSPGAASGGLEAVVGIGSDLLTVAVREGGIPRFVRTVALASSYGAQGGNDASAGPSDKGGSSGTARLSGTALAVGTASQVDSVVSEVRSSLEYLLSQSGSAVIDHVLVTGGGVMMAGLVERLSAAVGLPVVLAQASVQVDEAALGLDKEALTEAAYRWLTAIGLALWGTDAYGKPSLLPAEVMARRARRRLTAGATAAVLMVAAVLGVASVDRVHAASSITSQINGYEQQSTTLQVRINGLGYVVRIPDEVASERALAEEALNGDIDWLGTLARIEHAMPAGVTLETLSLAKTSTNVGPPPTPGSLVGTMGLTAQTTRGANAVAEFIDRMSAVKGLYALWVTSTTNTQGITQITASADLTTAVLSNRAAHLPGGAK